MSVHKEKKERKSSPSISHLHIPHATQQILCNQKTNWHLQGSLQPSPPEPTAVCQSLHYTSLPRRCFQGSSYFVPSHKRLVNQEQQYEFPYKSLPGRLALYTSGKRGHILHTQPTLVAWWKFEPDIAHLTKASEVFLRVLPALML